MRFWQKILIGTLLITLATFDLGTYILVRNAYQFTLQRETESARREEHVIFTNLTEEIKKEISINPNLLEDSNRLRAIIRNFSTHYSVTFAFYHNNMLVFNNAPDADIRLPSTLLIQEASVDGGHYIFISQPLDEFPELMLVYARDITALDEFSQSITNIFIGFSVIISLILAIALFLMVKKLTHPIGKLIQTTNEIAGGAFDRRVQIQSRDEFGILAENFNRMADSVEQKVEQLIEAAAQKERFINNLSHEMRTPLTSIMGYAGFMQNANCSEADRMVAAGHLEESAVRLKKLGDKLMEMVALKNFQIEKNPVDTVKLLKGVEAMLTPVFEDRKLTLSTHADIPVLYGDEPLLTSLICNLAENGARASQEGDTVWVRIGCDEHPWIEVRDTGIGIPPDQLSRIFEPFYRVDPSRSRKSGGAGLGLSLCAAIVQCHDATLNVDSTPGQGTTVRVDFTNC